MCFSVFIFANIPVKTKRLGVNLATLIPLLPKSRNHRGTLLLCSAEPIRMIHFMFVISAEASVCSDSVAHLCVMKILHLGGSLFTSSAGLALHTDVFGNHIIAKSIMRMDTADHNQTALWLAFLCFWNNNGSALSDSPSVVCWTENTSPGQLNTLRHKTKRLNLYLLSFIFFRVCVLGQHMELVHIAFEMPF